MSSNLDAAAVAGGVIATDIVNKKNGESNCPPPVKYHSIILWYFLGWIVLWIPCIYFTFSKRHKWRWF